MKKILAGIMSLALVMLLVPAYAVNHDGTYEGTQEGPDDIPIVPAGLPYKYEWNLDIPGQSITVDVNPRNLTAKLAWDFEENADREYCFSKTETLYWTYSSVTGTDPSYNPWVSFYGKNVDETFKGPLNIKTIDDIPESAHISCSGEMKVKLYELYDTSPTYFDSWVSMSFGEVMADGTFNWLNKGIVVVANVSEIDVDTNCDYVTFDRETALIIDRNSADITTYQKTDLGCQIYTDDLKEDGKHKGWFRNLP